MDKPPFAEASAIEEALSSAERLQSVESFKAAMDARVARGAAILLVMVMVGALASVVAVAAETQLSWMQRLARMANSGLVLMVAASSLVLARRISVRHAAAFFGVGTLGALIVMAAIHGNGIMSSGLWAMTTIVVVVGLMVGHRAAKWTAVSGVLSLMLLFAAELLGWIPGMGPGNSAPHGSYLVVQVFSVSLAGWLMYRYGGLFWDVTHSLDSSRQLLAGALRSQQQSAYALAESEGRMRRLLESSHTAIQIFSGHDGALRFANRQCLQRYGVDSLEALTQEMMWPEPPHGRERALGLIRQTLASGEQFCEWQSRGADGSPIWWDMKLDRFMLQDGEGVVVFAHDITQRVLAEQSLQQHRLELEATVEARTRELNAEKQRMQEVIEALPILLSIRDLEGRFMQVNRSFERASRLPRENLLGRTVAEVFSKAQAEDVASTDADVLARGSGLNTERQMQQIDGVHDYLVTTVPLREADGQAYALLSLGTDVTSLKRLHRELVLARDEAERHAQAKTQFLANMSHEIRTPLNAVLGLAQLGEQRAPDPRAAAESFRRIVRAGRHLLGVINDVLDYAKMDSGKLEIVNQPCQLALLMRDVLEMASDRASNKGLQLTSRQQEVPDWVTLDALRVTQILVNLLSNAVKFTDRGEVSLTVRSRRSGSRLVFEVRDTGVGIPPEKLESIFSPFEQADSSVTRLYGGTGLGLSISRKLAQLMGGDIRVSSRLGEGSCFSIELPLIEAKAPQRAAASDALPSGLHGLRILITDDVDINREILQDMLCEAGAEVMAAEGGEQALQRVREAGSGGFDLALMDVQMPGMDGYETTRRLLQLDPELPVLALTAHAMAEERQRCLAAGMCGHISKPVDREDLLRSLAVFRPRTRISQAGADLQEPATGGSSWPELDGCDFPGAVLRCAGRTELLAKLLMSFVRQYSQHMTALEEARIEGAMTLRSYAHRLRGVAANLGLDALARGAQTLERAVAHGEIGPPVMAAITALNRELAAHIQAIEAWNIVYMAEAA